MRYWRRRGNIGEKEKKFGEENNGEEEKTLGEKRECKRKRGTVGEEEREDGGSGAGRRAGSAVWARAKGGGQGGAGGGRGGPTSPIRRRCPRCPPPAAGMQGMELCAVAVVILLFIAVLKQFGILEPISVEADSCDADVELSAARHQPEALEQLQAHTKFTKKELQSLYRGFKNVSAVGWDPLPAFGDTPTPGLPVAIALSSPQDCPSGHVDEETFTLIYAQFFPQGDSSAYAHFLFNAFDADGSGALCFEDFVIGLSVLLRGTAQEKLKWAFNLYDINKDGCITKEEMLEIMKSIYDMMGRCTLPAPRDSAPAEHVEQFFQKMDRNRDGVVTYEEFLETCQQDVDIMSSMQIFENTI
eukprot:XP_015128747.2 calsenilin isoform X1 [Gallus gallus]